MAATIVVSNRGSAQGKVGAIGLAGAGFQLVGAPAPPASVDSGRDLRFTVNFYPEQRATYNGTLTVQLSNRTATFRLEGTGAAPAYIYRILRESADEPAVPNQVIALPDTAVGEKTAILVRVVNNGNADGLITGISVLGSGYQLTEVPFLPLTLVQGCLRHLCRELRSHPARPYSRPPARRRGHLRAHSQRPRLSPHLRVLRGRHLHPGAARRIGPLQSHPGRQPVHRHRQHFEHRGPPPPRSP